MDLLIGIFAIALLAASLALLLFAISAFRFGANGRSVIREWKSFLKKLCIMAGAGVMCSALLLLVLLAWDYRSSGMASGSSADRMPASVRAPDAPQPWDPEEPWTDTGSVGAVDPRWPYETDTVLAAAGPSLPGRPEYPDSAFMTPIGKPAVIDEAPLRAMVSADPLVDKIRAMLDTGTIAYNPPERMRKGETLVVQLILDPQRVAPAEIASAVTEPGSVAIQHVAVGPRMEARLSGSGFRVTPLAPERQPLGSSIPVEWRWSIYAEQEGEQRLDLVLSALVDIGDGAYETVAIRTFAHRMVVEVGPRAWWKEFIRYNLQFILPVILVPLGALVYSYYRLRRRRTRQRTGAPVSGPINSPDSSLIGAHPRNQEAEDPVTTGVGGGGAGTGRLE